MDVQASLATPNPVPQEIIALILRSSDLDRASLARCCLVSRRTLESARRNLYFSVDLVLLPTLVSDCRGNNLGGYNYNVTTAALMSTLTTCPHLTDHVRRVALVCVRRVALVLGYDYGKRSYVYTTPEATLRTILRHAPRTEHFMTNIVTLFDLTSKVERGQLDAIRSLDLACSNDRTFLPELNLRRLSMDERAFAVWDKDRPLPMELESFTMRPEPPPAALSTHLPRLLSRSMFTLTHLSIPFRKLAACENPSFPALVKLVVWISHATWSKSEIVAYQALLHKLSKLRVLSLRTASEVSVRSPLKLFATKPESLRRIELLGQFSLDHLTMILARPVEERIKEIGIYDPSLEITVNQELSTVRFAAVRRMCRAARVELVLIPPPPP